MLRITPLQEGELDILGFIYHLCVEPEMVGKTSVSPSMTGSRLSLPSMSISSGDSLYQQHYSSEVQHSLEEGIQVHANYFLYKDFDYQ